MQEDTDAALALAEEERDTCPQCGYPRDICRAGLELPFTDYEVAQEVCQATLRLEHFRESDDWQKKHAPTKAATQLSARFREGKAPPVDYGLGLGTEVGDGADDGAEQGEEEPHLQH